MRDYRRPVRSHRQDRVGHRTDPRGMDMPRPSGWPNSAPTCWSPGRSRRISPGSPPKCNNWEGDPGPLPADVTSEESVRGMVTEVVAGHGRIDILINDFGTRVRRPAIDFPVDDWQQVMDYNIRGCFVCCKEVGAEMVKNRSGKIINHSSVRAQYGFPGGYAAYSSSKGAIDALTKTLAVEWAPYNVFVNAIAPTFRRPNPGDAAFSEPDPEFVRMVLSRIPLGRLGEPGDFVGPALFLASSASDFFTGHTLFVDGGVTSW